MREGILGCRDERRVGSEGGNVDCRPREKGRVEQRVVGVMLVGGQRRAASIKYQNLFARIESPNPLTLIIHALIRRAACATRRVLVNMA